ncbi:hypothetical protein RCL_jg2992.t1 [Rhizophagus clarus]|uniref:Uncharacterized protein n=1 Tax=Rhizophagus clarus TaxID=94130 RepID=A0A8H3R4T1_9GLOM|nr:hypothetical protein RCL_jg2992.t1 [Rhizophagus clarus]
MVHNDNGGEIPGIRAFGFSPTHGRTSDVYIIDLSEKNIYKWSALFITQGTVSMKQTDGNCYEYVIPSSEEKIRTTIAMLLGGFGAGVCVATSGLAFSPVHLKC